MTTRPPAAFYCVTGGDFFPGAVALLNSLRLVGHREPLFVLDAGMQAGQRELLEPHATIVDGPRDAPPSLLKLAARRVHPAGAFRNDTDRFFAEWGRLLDLGELRRGRYLTSSALFLDAETADEILPLVEDRQRRVDLARTWVGSGSEADPLYFLDQDVINAVVRARLDPGRVVEYDARLAPIPPFNGVRLADETALRCRYDDGAEPHLLHHASRKPWLVTMRSNVYSRLLTRLLFGDDVTLRLDSRHLPLRLRRGTAAGAARLAVDFGVGAPAYARRKLFPRRIRAWQDSR